VVTINYRVNSVGYLAHPALYNEDPNMNWGIQDQQAALRWVKANIDAFGGDRDNVMVFGESAGGASTSLHVLMNSSKGLVNKVIIQSPGPWILPSKEKAYTVCFPKHCFYCGFILS
jgi:para-nitrobenzyl esterase